MKNFPANCPEWLSKKISHLGGTISFYDYMNITLNDPENGYYGSGKANVGIGGDFVTSPTMSDQFAILLSEQIKEWLEQLLLNVKPVDKLRIIEFGAGDGSLLRDIINYFYRNNERLLKSISFSIIELNAGMKNKQIENLKEFLDLDIEINWCELDDFKNDSINGIFIAHELFDAFPVERIQYSSGDLFQQVVSLDSSNEHLILENLKMNNKLLSYIEKMNNIFHIELPPKDIDQGWTTELHLDNATWLKNVCGKINNGILLVIDYAIDAEKYYSNKRQNGTLLTYKNQVSSSNILNDPGNCDLTSHICSDVLINEALLVGFQFGGIVKQGEALLALGLAEKLHEIQLDKNIDLSTALKKRESLLRLVDPICLGDFKWFVFKRFNNKGFDIVTKCIN